MCVCLLCRWYLYDPGGLSCLAVDSPPGVLPGCHRVLHHQQRHPPILPHSKTGPGPQWVGSCLLLLLFFFYLSVKCVCLFIHSVCVCVCVCHHNRPTFKTQQRSLYYNPCGKALTYEGRTMPITVRNPASLSFLNAIISGV